MTPDPVQAHIEVRVRLVDERPEMAFLVFGRTPASAATYLLFHDGTWVPFHSRGAFMLPEGFLLTQAQMGDALGVIGSPKLPYHVSMDTLPAWGNL